MNREEIVALAAQVRLELTEQDIDYFAGAVEEMIGYFKTMSKIDVGDLPLTTHASLVGNRLRPDRASGESSEYTDVLLKQASEVEDQFFVIPNVL